MYALSLLVIVCNNTLSHLQGVNKLLPHPYAIVDPCRAEAETLQVVTEWIALYAAPYLPTVYHLRFHNLLNTRRRSFIGMISAALDTHKHQLL